LVNRARLVAKIAATDLLSRLNSQSALDVARAELNPPAGRLGFNWDARYFAALRERNRLDLSVEFLVTQSPWLKLFSVEERDTALERLTKGGFSPGLVIGTEADNNTLKRHSEASKRLSAGSLGLRHYRTHKSSSVRAVSRRTARRRLFLRINAYGCHLREPDEQNVG
jgi:hypothetical protein